MKKIGLFGGAFDPPHLGHIYHLNALLRCATLDEIWVVPAGERVDKTYAAPQAKRLDMIRSALNEFFPNDGRLLLKTLQMENHAPSTTIGLLDTVKQIDPHSEFWVVIGHELLQDLPRWVEPERLRKEGKFLVLQRAGFVTTAASAYSIEWLDATPFAGPEISSSDLRHLIKGRGEYRGLVPAAVFDIIEDSGLYLDKKL
jgi:nicotinate-nucleotide adenylyltransferase